MSPKTEKIPSLASLLSKLSPDQLKVVVDDMAKSAPESLRVLADLADARAPGRYPRISWQYYPRYQQPVFTDPGFYISTPISTAPYKMNEIYCGAGGSTDLSTGTFSAPVTVGSGGTAFSGNNSASFTH